ncbi:hypothetical protein AAX29_01123 [Aliarcobacter thereius]|uniref:Uncharacterized protein n=1 Tax=Aliarcobacter thereius TaxID=544718 RepID=A0A1C0B6V7_9BACT|nr:hypothetical protein [Aliarcobacter thereius]OCL99311.1 hypothetical protein AAX29_01123 [Aliarcobacter thereius]TLS71891.1 hypothetical protein FE246_05560 [Aliarcobacter thereius]
MVLRENFSPSFYLKSLASGVLSISFFIYLMFLVPHENSPIITFWDILEVLKKGDYITFITTFSLVFVIAFAVIHYKLLLLNSKEFLIYRKTESYKNLFATNKQVLLIVIPLTFTTSILLTFILAVILIPSFWSIVQYIFPLVFVGFAINGIYTLKIFFNYFARILLTGEFNFGKKDQLLQIITIFAFSMTAVGFASLGAMSTNITLSSIGVFASLFFATLASVLTILKFTFGFRNIKKGMNIESALSLSFIIPILTLLGITFIRITFGLEHNFDKETNSIAIFILGSIILTLQIIFGIFSSILVKKLGTLEKFINENIKSALSFILIFPAIAFFIFGMFFINIGIVNNEIVEKYSTSYFVLMIPFVLAQFKAIISFFKLKKRFDS